MILYHFTSDTGHAAINRAGELHPRLHYVLGQHLLWLTDQPAPKARELGLTRRRNQHDRMAHRIEVNTTVAVPWAEIRDQFTDWEISTLEGAPGANPTVWFVSREPIPLNATPTESTTT